jgi:hypothetical protein
MQVPCPVTNTILTLDYCRLGYKMVMPKDGSGQVYLVPPGGGHEGV